MRVHVTFIDRVGITQEVLALLGSRNLNLDAVEMVPPNVYIDAPTLCPEVLEELREALFRVEGVQAVKVVDLLPGQRRNLQLEALLAAMPDPLLVVDAQARVLFGNPALLALVADIAELDRVFAEPGWGQRLREQGFRLPLHEVTLAGQAWLVDAVPIRGLEPTPGPAGGLLTLYAPNRIGGRMSALQHDYAEGFEALMGQSPAVASLKHSAQRLALLDAPLMIQGETGTGKELVARACHAASKRNKAPFLALNCAALPEQLAESELFGYAPGAFTGARRGGKPGLLELADQGTVLLDEIGEMSPYLQAKLLRFLSDGSFRRVGGEREQRVDVRILCATHRDLPAMVAAGSFREDLYYRLNVLSLTVPPLRERGHDVLLLARHFLAQSCEQIQRPLCRLSSEAVELLVDNPWPGNVRQLRNAIFRAAAICEGPLIRPEDLALATPSVLATEAGGPVQSLADAVADFERGLLSRLYPQYPSTRQLAARLATSHSAIAMRLRRYGIG